MSKIQKESTRMAFDLEFQHLNALWMVEFKTSASSSAHVLVAGTDITALPAILFSGQFPIRKPVNTKEQFLELTKSVSWEGIIAHASANEAISAIYPELPSGSRRPVAVRLIRWLEAQELSPKVLSIVAYKFARAVGVSSPVELVSNTLQISPNTLKKRVAGLSQIKKRAGDA